MTHNLILKLTISIILIFLNLLNAGEWNFLDVNRIGAASFIKKNPQWNGKDVVIIILDTGVDIGTPGLKELPDGGVKVIDVQDFSGEGDVQLEKAEADSDRNEQFLKRPDGLKLFGYEQLTYQAQDSIYFIGVLAEERFRNSVIPDINGNDKKNDQFGVIVFKSVDGWLAYVDLDADGNVSDEQPIWNYKEKLQSFRFRNGNADHISNLASFALNIFSEEKKVVFHYDGSSHGTHVAGIAAGYKINGQDGFNGIAPGAKLISLKIGDGRLAGGATTTGSMQKAYAYGIEFARNYAGPVVFNMSFGVGSEIEGQAEMDLLLDDWLEENDKLVFCVSAGNEGPGISSVGLPAASKKALTVGALNTRETARDVYGADLNEDKIFVFSSRGGEINKPDVLAPGGASSTVPPFDYGEVKWGTSMASPQAAGAVALIMSAACQQNPALPIFGALIKRAIKNSAGPLPGYFSLEQGDGVIDVSNAFEYYRNYINSDYHENYVEYEISTLSPIYSSENGECAYWRFGNYLPAETEKQQFYVSPIFSEKMTAEARNEFFRAFDLFPSAPWIKVNKRSAYIKGNKAMTIEVHYDSKQLTKTGLYNGKILACRKDGLSGDRLMNKEFELMCTYINPLQFNESNAYHWSSGEIALKNGDVQRFFFDVPYKASAAIIKARTIQGKYAQVSGYLFDPQGKDTDQRLYLNSQNQTESVMRLNSNDLRTGSWELDLYADFKNAKTSLVEMTIAFSGLEASPDVISHLKIKAGADPRGKFDITNHYSGKVTARLNGSIFGIQKVHDIESDSDIYEYAFKVNDEYEKVIFDFELEPQVYNMFTDFAINVKDETGKAVIVDGLSYRKKKINFIPTSAGNYVLELIPAFAAKKPKSWNLSITETFYLFKKMNVIGNSYDFYPGIKKEVDFKIDGGLPVAPDGYYLVGEIWLDHKDVNKFRLVIPMTLYTGMND